MQYVPPACENLSPQSNCSGLVFPPTFLTSTATTNPAQRKKISAVPFLTNLFLPYLGCEILRQQKYPRLSSDSRISRCIAVSFINYHLGNVNKRLQNSANIAPHPIRSRKYAKRSVVILSLIHISEP